jgi:uncharacterized membrane protein YfcA
MTELLETTALGLLAGVMAALFGIGGGIPFVATLTLVVGLGQLEAQATSLAAMVPVAAVGAWQQSRYGNVAWRPAVALGRFSATCVAAGTAVATSLPEDTLRRLFAALLLVVAARLAWSARRPSPPMDGDSGHI